MEPYIIDAQDKTTGRVASEAAKVLLGKTTAAFVKNKVVGKPVIIQNASKLKISEKRMLGTNFVSYSGYPGGQKITRMDTLIAKKGHKELLKNAIQGMLPSTKLRRDIMKMLIINN